MGKKMSSTLPLTPIIYVNDPQVDKPNIIALTSLIPYNETCPPNVRDVSYCTVGLSKQPRVNPAILIIEDDRNDDEHNAKLDTADKVKAVAIKQGRNFVSVNLYLKSGTPASKLKKWGTNHLDLDIARLTTKEAGKKIYDWLFTVFSLPEQLHLHAPSKFTAIDTKNFAEYAYCPLAEAKTHPKDAKIQFVAMIVSKPVITRVEEPKKIGGPLKKVQKQMKPVAEKDIKPLTDDEVKKTKFDAELAGTTTKMTWTVMDQTGTATFYYIFRHTSTSTPITTSPNITSPPSKRPTSPMTTYNFILSLQPGQIKALPRMPSLALTESTPMRIAKFPLRMLGLSLMAAETLVTTAVAPVGAVGEALWRGGVRSVRYVPAADVEGTIRKKVEEKQKAKREERQKAKKGTDKARGRKTLFWKKTKTNTESKDSVTEEKDKEKAWVYVDEKEKWDSIEGKFADASLRETQDRERDQSGNMRDEDRLSTASTEKEEEVIGEKYFL